MQLQRDNRMSTLQWHVQFSPYLTEWIFILWPSRKCHKWRVKSLKWHGDSRERSHPGALNAPLSPLSAIGFIGFWYVAFNFEKNTLIAFFWWRSVSQEHTEQQKEMFDYHRGNDNSNETVNSDQQGQKYRFSEIWWSWENPSRKNMVSINKHA